MSQLHPLYSFLVFAVILVSVKISERIVGLKLSEVKFKSIDGLRGYLAVFVFIHHGAIWLNYKNDGVWKSPDSNLYNHFGQTSVILFFMVTGFLFYNKLFDHSHKPMDWLKFYISRFLRIAPLYYLALIFMFVVVFHLSGYQLIESPISLFKKIMEWLSFCVTDMPDLNGIENTRYILAWVTWTLIYEWLFYFSLPLVALVTFKIKTSRSVLFFSLLMLIIIFYNIGLHLMYLLPFAGGILAAIIYRTGNLMSFLNPSTWSVIAVLSLAATVTLFSSPYGTTQIILLSVFFTIISNGNSLFGLLHLNVSRALGQISYTIYLMHGIFLYTAFTFFIDNGGSETEHWIKIAAIAIVLAFASRIIYTFYEGPCSRSAGRLTDYLRRKTENKKSVYKS